MQKSKKFLVIFLALCLSLLLAPAAAAEETSGTFGEDMSWTLDTDTGVLTISGTGVIEYEVYDEPPWYSQQEYITEVVIEDGVTGISEYAFFYCLNLVSVTIPASVTYIGFIPFELCPSLTEILVSEENEYYTSVDGVLFDKDMTELICYPAGKADTSYVIPSGVAIIDIGAFVYSFNLTSVTVPETVTDIGLEAFICCTALTEILVSDSSTAYCSADGVLFSKDMTSLICYPEGKTDVSYTIPDGVTYIEHAAFAFCTSLTDVTIPKSVTAIGANAFYSYDKETLYEEINEGSDPGFYTIFLECATLSDVYYCGSEDDWDAINIGNYNTGLETATIHYNSVAEDTGDSGDSGDTGDTGDSGDSGDTSGTGDSEGSEIISGTCGENLTWTLVDGVLTISGEGEMEDYGHGRVPWYSDISSITVAVIEYGVTSIGDYAFRGCSNLTSVSIPDSVTYIGDCAFFSCDSLLNVSLPSSLTYIGNEAFMYCENLINVTIYGSITSINDGTFSYCSNLVSVTIPDSVTYIGYDAFGGCINLTNATIPSSVTYIGNGAFGGCGNLTNATIPDSVTYIGDAAFFCCTNLSDVTIPECTTYIGYYAFAGCSSLSEILVSAENDYYTSKNGVLFSKDATELLCYPAGNKISYVVPDGVTSISCGAFYECSLTGISIPDSVTYIGDTAFWNCKGLTSISIPSSVTYIDYDTFSGCSGLTSISIPDSVTYIGDGAFRECSGLTSITIPDSVTYIGFHAFESCTNLKSISIPDSVTSIVGCTFSNCNSLVSVTIPDSITYIDSNAFSCCTSLMSITIPSSVTYINYCAFSDCEKLADVYYGGNRSEWNAIEIGEDNDCLTSATIHFNDGTTSGGSTGDSGSTSETLSGVCGDSLTWTLEDGILTVSGSGYMYDYEEVEAPWLSLTDSITDVVIEDGVLGISTYAFYGCANLTSITWPDSLLYIGKCAFDECYSLEDITLPSGLTTLGTSFYGSVYYNDETNWTDNALYIDGWLAAVSDCSEESFTVETGTVGIAMGVLAGYDLQSVYIPDSVKYICDYAFAYCEALTDVYYSGSEEDWNAIEIGAENDFLLNAAIAYDSSWGGGGAAVSYYSGQCGEFVFWGIRRGQDLTIYGDGDMYDYTPEAPLYSYFPFSFTSVVIEDGVTSIGAYTFYECSLRSITMPEGITSIGDYAFFGCGGLNSITIPDGVTSIGDYAFSECCLMSITIPDSMTSIGAYAFSECNGLIEVYYTGSESDWNAIAIAEGNDCLTYADIHFSEDTSDTGSGDSGSGGGSSSGGSSSSSSAEVQIEQIIELGAVNGDYDSDLDYNDDGKNDLLDILSILYEAEETAETTSEESATADMEVQASTEQT